MGGICEDMFDMLGERNVIFGGFHVVFLDGGGCGVVFGRNGAF